MGDARLVALAVAAERGERVPRVRIATASLLITGKPTSGSRFSELTRNSLVADLVAYFRDDERARLARKERSDAATLQANADERADAALAFLRDAENDAGALCLEHADCWPWAGGDGIRLPAMRIPLAAINAWWVTGGTPLKAPSEGPTWFGGVLVPLQFDS